MPTRTASCLALSVYRQFEQHGAGFVPQYLDMLSRGGSMAPEDLGRIVGVDLADPSFWDGGLDIVGQRLDAAEAAAGRERACRHARRMIGPEAALLTDKVAVVTGGGGGIGRAVSESFAACGARVVIAEIDAERAAETEVAIRAAGGDAMRTVVATCGNAPPRPHW